MPRVHRYESRAPSLYVDRECKNRSVCNTTFQYYLTPGNRTSDARCGNLTTCPKGMSLAVRLSATLSFPATYSRAIPRWLHQPSLSLCTLSCAPARHRFLSKQGRLRSCKRCTVYSTRQSIRTTLCSNAPVLMFIHASHVRPALALRRRQAAL